MPVSESEKFGVSVMGCCFSEKAEHVPIKKRRFLFRSPSPPPRTSSPHPDETEKSLKSRSVAINHAASKNDLGQILNTEGHFHEKNLVRVQDDNQDFLGISILAAAACSKSFVGDDGHADGGSGFEESFAFGEVSINNESYSLSKEVSREGPSSTEISTEGTGSCISVVPAEELAACLRGGNSSVNSLSHRINMKDICMKDHSMAVSKDSVTNKVMETVRTQDFSSRDDRSHWDLNTAMNAWGCPFDYQSSNVKDDSGGYELQSEHGGTKCYAEKAVPSSDSGRIAHKEQQLNVERNKLDIFTNTDRTSCSQEKFTFSKIVPADSPIGSLACIYEDTHSTRQCLTFCPAGISEGLSTNQVANLGLSAENTFSLKPNYSLSTCVSVGICDAESAIVFSSGFAAGTCIVMEKQAVVPSVALSGNPTCGTGVVLNKDTEDDSEIYGLHDDKNASNDIISSETCKPLETVPPSDELENPAYHYSDSSPLALEMPIPGSLVGGLPSLIVNTKTQDEEVSVHHTAEAVTVVCNDGGEPETKSSDRPKVLLPPSSVSSYRDACRSNFGDVVKSSDKMALEKPSEIDYDSNASHDDCCPVKAGGPEVDYDSQYEDGEVRESIFHAWEEYDAEGLEDERVDYGSDNANNLGPEAEHILKITTEAFSQSGKERELKGKDSRNEVHSCDIVGNKDIETCAKGDDITDSRMKISGQDRGSRRDSSVTMVGRMNIDGNCMDGLEVEDAEARMVGSREVRRALQSHTNGRASRDVFLRKDKPWFQESSDAGDWSSRSERESGHVESFRKCRYVQHAHGRGSHWVYSYDSCRGLKHHHSPNYHGPVSFRRPVPENGAFGRHIMDAPSHGVHRRGSLVDRDQAFCMRFGIRPAREFSPGRRVTFGRGRPIMYGPQTHGRGFRGGRYHGPCCDEYIEPSLNHSHPSAKRERSFSPFGRRGNPCLHRYHRRSRSRSRTRSPNSGNMGFRRQSKSPNLRPEVKMQRVKSPHQRPGFLADHTVGFRSMTRSHGSPPHNSRWIGDRKDGVFPFRGKGYNQRSSVLYRRSPRGYAPHDDRFDLDDSPRNYRSRHPGRFLEMHGGRSGGFRYGGNDDDRGKHGFRRYGMIHPVKRYDMDGAVKQFRNAEDGFLGARNSRSQNSVAFQGRGSPKDYGRDTDSRTGNVPR